MILQGNATKSGLCANSTFGDKVIDEVAAYIAKANPSVKGSNRRSLYRMKQFYETYKDDEFVTLLVTQISWTNHLLLYSVKLPENPLQAERKRFEGYEQRWKMRFSFLTAKIGFEKYEVLLYTMVYGG